MDKVIINGKECDVYTNNQINIQYNSSIFGTIGDLLSGFTYTIHLPLTDNNKRIIDFSQMITVDTKFPYKSHKAIIERNGIQIVEGDLYILSIADDIECSVVFGNRRDVDSRISKDETIADLFDDEHTTYWGGTNLSWQDYLEKGGRTKKDPFYLCGLDHNETRTTLHPVINASFILKKIQEKYDIDYDFETSAFDNYALLLAKRGAREEAFTLDSGDFDLTWRNVDDLNFVEDATQWDFINSDDGKWNYQCFVFRIDEDPIAPYVKNEYVQFVKRWFLSWDQYSLKRDPTEQKNMASKFFPIAQGFTMSFDGQVSGVVICNHISRLDEVKFVVGYIKDVWLEESESSTVLEKYHHAYGMIDDLYEFGITEYEDITESYKPAFGSAYRVTFSFDKEKESDEICGITNPFRSDWMSVDVDGDGEFEVEQRTKFMFFGVKKPFDVYFNQHTSYPSDFDVIFKKKHVFRYGTNLNGHYPIYDTNKEYKDFSLYHTELITEGNYYVKENLPKLSVKEFLEGMAAITGNVITKVDGKLTLRPILDAYDKSKAVNLSNNLLNSNPYMPRSTKFALDEAAKENKFKFSDGFYDGKEWDYTIEIESDTIDKEESTITELPFNKFRESVCAILPIYSYEDEEIEKADPDKPDIDPITDEKVRLHHLKLDETDDAYLAIIDRNNALGYHLTSKGLHWEDIIKSKYGNYETIFKNAKVITEDFLLTPLELKALDLSRPIYLDKYHSYFVINKVTTKANNVCEVELIKI